MTGFEVDFTVEAAVSACVAGSGSDLFDIQDEGILVAVGADFVDFLDVAGGGSFVPDFLSAARKIDSFPELKGHFEGLSIHVGEHQGLFAGSVDCHGGDQPVGIKFGSQYGVFLERFFIFAGTECDVGGWAVHVFGCSTFTGAVEPGAGEFLSAPQNFA